MTGNDDAEGGGEAGEGQRGRGVITHADRQFLAMSPEEREEEYSKSAVVQRWNAIRERLENALLDFPLLARRIDDDVLEDVFGPDRGAFEGPDGEEVVGSQLNDGQVRGVPFGILLLLRIAVADSWNQTKPEFGVEDAAAPFINDLESAIEMWLNYEHNLSGDVAVNVEVDNLQRAEDLVEEIEAMEEPPSGFERIEVVSELSRAGYSKEEIGELLGEVAAE